MSRSYDHIFVFVDWKTGKLIMTNALCTFKEY